MNEVRFYKNPAPYPDYAAALVQVGEVRNLTPRNMDYKTGFMDVEMTFSDVLACNYLSIKRDAGTIHAWIMNVEERAGDMLYRVHYQVDAFRTFRNKLVLKKQWIVRDGNPTYLKDNLLSSLQAYPDIHRETFEFDDAGWRTLIIQVRDLVTPTPVYKSTPVQPSPYVMYMKTYQVNSWAQQQTIVDLIHYLGNSAKTSNVVTMYSVPGVLYTIAGTDSLQLKFATDAEWSNAQWVDGPVINGLRKYDGSVSVLKNSKEIILNAAITPDIFRVEHSVSLVTPDGGIMRIPDELLFRYRLSLTRYVDIYSGSVNYLLEAPDPAAPEGELRQYNVSIRAGGMASIPILSNPMDTYLSQNQSAIVSSLVGDVATIGIGVGAGFMFGPMAAMPGIAAGIGGLTQTFGNTMDANRQTPSNPPAVLGAALAPHFDGKFWIVTAMQHVDNEDMVHERFGYPQNTTKSLVIPASGFIQTKNCNVQSDGTVPLWAISEVNGIMNNGLRVI